MRLVLDTNVLVSALHFSASNPRRILDLVLRGEHDLVTGVAVFQELDAVLVEELGEVVTVTDVRRVCRDPDDDEVLASAVTGGAEVVVTGDKDLLVLGEHESVLMLTLREFLDRLRSSE